MSRPPQPPARLNTFLFSSRGSSVSIVTTLRAGRPGFVPGRSRDFFSSPPRPDRLWVTPSLLSNGYRGSFTRG
jgi:hypothetical protein